MRGKDRVWKYEFKCQHIENTTSKDTEKAKIVQVKCIQSEKVRKRKKLSNLPGNDFHHALF